MDDYGSQVAVHPAWVNRVEKQLSVQTAELARMGACLAMMTEMQRDSLEVMKGYARLEERLNNQAHRLEQSEAAVIALRAAKVESPWEVIRNWVPTIITVMIFLGITMKIGVGG